MSTPLSSPPRDNAHYRQIVRTWRLAEFVVGHATQRNPSEWIAPRPSPTVAWADLLESTTLGLVAWCIGDIDTPLTRAKLSQILQWLQSAPEAHRTGIIVDHFQAQLGGLDLRLVNGLAKASRATKGSLARFVPKEEEHACLVGLSRILLAPAGTNDQAPSTPQLDEDVLEELTNVFDEEETARLLLDRAGFPTSRIPRFSTPQVFWHKIAKEACKGLLPRGMHTIFEAAARLYEHNPSFLKFSPVSPGPEAISSADLEKTFELLGRLEIRIVYEEADVLERSIRALHHIFEDPERLTGALHAFAAQVPSGVQVQFDDLHEQVLEDFGRRTVPWLPVPAGPPDEEILLWHRDSRGKARTLWLSSEEPNLIVADIPGMYLGSERCLWRWDTCSVLVPFATNRDFMFDDDEEFDEGPIELRPVPSARLTNVDNGVVLSLGAVNNHSDESNGWVFWCEHEVEPLGSVNDILVSWARVSADSGGAHGWQDACFFVLDLQSGREFKLLTDEDKKGYVRTFANETKRAMPQAMGEFNHETREEAEPEDPVITTCRPFYDDTYSLSLELQFTFETCYADTDGSWSDYCASTRIATKDLPSTLTQLANAPAILRDYWDHYLKHDRCGWTRVPSPGRARERLEALVREHQSKPLAANDR